MCTEVGRQASETLADGGVVIVDDYFAEGWPGVSEGVQAFFREQDSAGKADTDSMVVPFFVGFNKVLLTTRAHAGGYMDAL